MFLVMKKRATNQYFEKRLDFQPKSSLYSALASPEPQLQRQLPYKSWLGALGPDCDLTPKIGHLQKTEIAFKA